MAGWWFSPDTRVSSTNKTDRHDVTEILLEVALNTITLVLTTVLFTKQDNATDKPSFRKDSRIMN